MSAEEPDPVPKEAPRSLLPAGFLVGIVFLASALGYAVTLLEGVAPGSWLAWGSFAVVSLLVGLAALPLGVLIARRIDGRTQEAVQVALSRQAAERIEADRRLRHDLRGALSPALLTADRLLAHEDPKVQRAGQVMVRSVERASALLAETTPPADL